MTVIHVPLPEQPCIVHGIDDQTYSAHFTTIIATLGKFTIDGQVTRIMVTMITILVVIS